MSIRAHFLIDAMEARKVLREILEDKDVNPMIRYQVAKDFLDRAGFKALEKQEVNQNSNITVEFNIPRPTKK
ncbi:hypothetical protein [Peribacillus kribbensis]|uniref:hypothetical protein n=1 Tax=Peribacillus kribbensis TaxID=356658 RepID=UPI000479C5B1